MKVNTQRDGKWIWDEDIAKRREPKTMTLNMPANEMNQLELMADLTGQDKTSVVRQALRAYFVLFVKQDAGAKFYFKKDDEVTELLLT